MIDLPGVLTGIVLLVVAMALLLFARRSVTRVESADTTEQRSGGFHLWGPFERWFGIVLLGVPILLLLLVGALLLLGSLGLGLPGPAPNH